MQSTLYWLEVVELFLWAASFVVLITVVVGLFRQWRELRQGVVITRCLPSKRAPGWLVPFLGLTFAIPCFIGLLVLTDGRRLIVQLVVSLLGAFLVWAIATGLYASLFSRISRRLRDAELWDRKANSVCALLQRKLVPDEIHHTCHQIWHRSLHCTRATLFLLVDHTFQVRIREVDAPTPDPIFSFHSLLANTLRQGGGSRCLLVADLSTGRPLRWANGLPSRFASEHATLSSLDARLVVPLLRGDLLLGFWVLGPPEPGFGYRAPQIRFALSIAIQAVSSLAAAQAAKRAIDESLSAWRAQTDSNLASEIRQFLLTSDHPSIPGLEYSIAWLPSSSADGSSLWDVRIMPTGEACFLSAQADNTDPLTLLKLLEIKERFHQLGTVTLETLCDPAADDPPGYVCLAHYHPDSARLRFRSSKRTQPILLKSCRDGAKSLRPLTSTTEETILHLEIHDLLALPDTNIFPPDDQQQERQLLRGLLRYHRAPTSEACGQLLGQATDLKGAHSLLLVRQVR